MAVENNDVQKLIRKFGNNSKYTLDEIKNICLARGYECLSTEYINARTKITVKCQKGHINDVLLGNLVKYNCVECMKCKKKTINDFIELCNSIGYRLLPEQNYINNITPLYVSCDKGHVIKMRYACLSRGKRCIYCRNVSRHSIAYIKAYCESLGFKMVDNEYHNNKKPIRLQCKNEHIFTISYSNLTKGKGCPKCSSSREERIVGIILYKMFNVEFIKVKPDFLINPKTNKRLELDFYNSDLNLAFEYQGLQHYIKVSKFKMDDDRLILQKERDKIKKEICSSLNINLIEIPSLYSKIKLDNVSRFISSKLKEYNINIQHKIDIDITKVLFEVNTEQTEKNAEKICV